MLKNSVNPKEIAVLWFTTIIITESMSYAVLDKDTIKNYILPYLPLAKRGFATKSCMIEIVNAILYKLKTGCHWKMLPAPHLFTEIVLGWNAVYHHFRKWCKGGHWKQMWINLLMDNKASVELPLSHTLTFLNSF